ncbi:MAG: helix-turn-helix domain-containing protein [Chloroflexi bacterium]|nr:helix-turn-helix domain-containing protein [Chloroflexota bacterium]
MISAPTAYNWHKLWRENGVEGLANKARPGRKPKATDAYCLKLEEALSKEPSEYGYRFAIWTSDRLRAHLEKETGIPLSETRFRALLKKKGYRYHRPKHDLSHLQDKAAKKKAEKLLEEIKKEPPRRFRTPLCGRSQPSPGPSLACLLDEARAPEDHSCVAAQYQTTLPYLWSLFMENRSNFLAMRRLEE